MKNLIYIIALACLFGCGGNNQFEEIENCSKKEIRFNSLDVEKLLVPDFPTSTIGFSVLQGDAIYFGDQNKREVFEYIPECDSVRKVLGYGRGPREIDTGIDAMTYNGDELCIVSDIVISKYKMDSTGWFNRSSQFVAWIKRSDDGDMAERPDTYTKLYPKLRCREHNDTVYVSIAGNHPLFNPFIPGYFDKTRLIKGIPLQKQSKEFIFGQFSPQMKEQKGRYSFFMFDFDTDAEGDIYVTGELDSLIYKYDHTFRAVQCWGYAGEDMNFGEHKWLSESAFKQDSPDERHKAHYRKIKCIDNYIFRSYVKSLTAECDGLQIYDGKTLIADVEVPKGLNVIGKIGDWYYSELVSDEPSMKMWVYRFRIK